MVRNVKLRSFKGWWEQAQGDLLRQAGGLEGVVGAQQANVGGPANPIIPLIGHSKSPSPAPLTPPSNPPHPTSTKGVGDFMCPGGEGDGRGREEGKNLGAELKRQRGQVRQEGRDIGN